MTGETDLGQMLVSLEPVLDPRRFAFASFPNMMMTDAACFSPVAVICEREGLTVIAEEAALVDDVSGDLPAFSMITLGVHSSLEAVGLTAAVSSALTTAGISANMVAAAFHDHLFVPADRADEAMAVLRNLSEEVI